MRRGRRLTLHPAGLTLPARCPAAGLAPHHGRRHGGGSHSHGGRDTDANPLRLPEPVSALRPPEPGSPPELTPMGGAPYRHIILFMVATSMCGFPAGSIVVEFSSSIRNATSLK